MPKIPHNRKSKGGVKKNLTKLINKVNIYILLYINNTLYQYFTRGEEFWQSFVRDFDKTICRRCDKIYSV